jgi:hypothetical protein
VSLEEPISNNKKESKKESKKDKKKKTKPAPQGESGDRPADRSEKKPIDHFTDSEEDQPLSK